MTRPARLGFFDLPLEIREVIYADVCSGLGSTTVPALCKNTTTPPRQYRRVTQCCCRHITIPTLDMVTCLLVNRQFGHELLGIWAETTTHHIPLEIEFLRPVNGRLVKSSELAYGIWTHLRDHFDALRARYGPAIVARIRHVTLSGQFKFFRYGEYPVTVLAGLHTTDIMSCLERLEGIHDHLQIEVKITRDCDQYVSSALLCDGRRGYKQKLGRWTFVVSPTQVSRAEDRCARVADWYCVDEKPVQTGIRLKADGLEQEDIEWA
ncbi:hypothetical protein LTR10_003732 [Elasticomyces elasticus]|nr:hypothetical protein LTR10_003732 [Elasticomyces elasticus]KAK4978076.1 hypothetical protein LTR42_002453 [Elasticomyces elasticus]